MHLNSGVRSIILWWSLFSFIFHFIPYSTKGATDGILCHRVQILICQRYSCHKQKYRHDSISLIYFIHMTFIIRAGGLEINCQITIYYKNKINKSSICYCFVFKRKYNMRLLWKHVCKTRQVSLLSRLRNSCCICN